MKQIRGWYMLFTNDTLYVNSVYLIISTGVVAVFGFVFWIINARLFSTEEVGIGTTLISLVTLLSSICLLGLGNSLIKFLPTSENKNEKINTSFAIITLASLIVSIFYLLFLGTFSPKLMFIRENVFFTLLFILFVITTSLNSIMENIFIAYRFSKYILIKNVVYGLCKLALPFFLIGLSAFGIFASFGFATTAAFLTALVFLFTKFHFSLSPAINKTVVKKMVKFSLTNYLVGFINGLPATILPIVITNSIGARFSAYFYMDMMIASFLYVIPQATSQSLFAEGSYNENEVHLHLKKAVRVITLILTPAILGSLLLGKYVLLTFGEEYSTEGVALLYLLAASGIFVSINYLGNAILYIQQKIKKAFILSLIGTLLVLGLSYALIEYSLLGIGIAWLVGNAVVSSYYITVLLKKRFIQVNSL